MSHLSEKMKRSTISRTIPVPFTECVNDGPTDTISHSGQVLFYLPNEVVFQLFSELVNLIFVAERKQLQKVLDFGIVLRLFATLVQ